MDGVSDEGRDGCVDGGRWGMGELMDGWVNEWVNEWVSEWINEWMNEWMSK